MSPFATLAIAACKRAIAAVKDWGARCGFINKNPCSRFLRNATRSSAKRIAVNNLRPLRGSVAARCVLRCANMVSTSTPSRTRTGMEVGMMMVFASYGWDNCPDDQVWEEEIRLARLAADLGFDVLWSAEHHFNDYSFVPDNL